MVVRSGVLNMTIFYSKTTNSFYDDAINPVIPEGSVELDQEKHDYLMHGLSSGKALSCDDDGNPILIDIPPLPDPVLLENCKNMARAKLADTDWSQTADIGTLLVNQDEFTQYRAQVRDLFFNPVTAPVWPDVPVAVWR